MLTPWPRLLGLQMGQLLQGTPHASLFARPPCVRQLLRPPLSKATTTATFATGSSTGSCTAYAGPQPCPSSWRPGVGVTGLHQRRSHGARRYRAVGHAATRGGSSGTVKTASGRVRNEAPSPVALTAAQRIVTVGRGDPVTLSGPAAITAAFSEQVTRGGGLDWLSLRNGEGKLVRVAVRIRFYAKRMPANASNAKTGADASAPPTTKRYPQIQILSPRGLGLRGGERLVLSAQRSGDAIVAERLSAGEPVRLHLRQGALDGDRLHIGRLKLDMLLGWDAAEALVSGAGGDGKPTAFMLLNDAEHPGAAPLVVGEVGLRENKRLGRTVAFLTGITRWLGRMGAAAGDHLELRPVWEQGSGGPPGTGTGRVAGFSAHLIRQTAAGGKGKGAAAGLVLPGPAEATAVRGRELYLTLGGDATHLHLKGQAAIRATFPGLVGRGAADVALNVRMEGGRVLGFPISIYSVGSQHLLRRVGPLVRRLGLERKDKLRLTPADDGKTVVAAVA